MKKFSLLCLFALMASICTFAQTTITWSITGPSKTFAGGETVDTPLNATVTGGSGTWTAYCENGYASSTNLGSSNNPFSGTITLTESSIPTDATIKEVSMTAKTGSKGSYTINVNVNDVLLGTMSGFNSTSSTQTVSGELSGNQIVFVVTSASKYLLITEITVTYEEEDAPATELTAPVISGVENGGVYWNSATVNISKPELAKSIAYDVKKGGVSVAKADAATEAFSQEFTEAGTYTVTASATDGSKTEIAESVSFIIKSGAVASIAELLEKGPQSEYSGATFIFTRPLTVTYASGKNVYVRDAAENALLLYNSAEVTIANGSTLEGVTGTYTLYLSNIPELSTTSLPTATAGDVVAPKTIKIAEAAANMSQYVQIKNVTFNSSATEIECEGKTLAFYKGKGTVPSNLTAKYTVIGVISYYNNAVQLNYINAIEEGGALGTPVIEVAGETNAEGAYLDKVELTFVYPANATSMEYKIGSNDAVTVTGTTKIPYSTCGETTIEVTAYQNNDDLTQATKTIKIIPSAPTVSLAAGTYYEAQTLTITAPEGATLDGMLDDVDIKDVSTYTTTLVAVDGEATTYELLVNSKKDGVPSDLVSATFVIDPNTIDLRKTGTIVFADQDPNKFIASGANMKKDTEYILTDDLNNEYTIKSTITGSTYPKLQTDGTLRVYSSNGNVLYLSNENLNINKVEIAHNRTEITINGTAVSANNGISTWEATEECHSLIIVPTTIEKNTDITSIAISYGGLEHFEKVADGNALLSMEAGKFYQVNVNLEGVKENGGVLYARTADDSVEPSDPKKNFFDKGYEDYDLTKFTQRDWVAIDGLSSEYAEKQIATGFVARYDGTKLVPVTNVVPGDGVSFELNTFGVANVFYGNYENTEGLGMTGGYQPFFVKAKVNEVANFLGSVKLNADGKYELWGSGVCGKFNEKGLEIEANGTELAASATYKQIEGVLVADAAANGRVKLIAMNVTDTPTGVESLKANGKAAIYGTEGAVVVAGADGKVAIFDAMGRMVKSVSAEGAATVEMPAGYYIVRTAGTAKAVIVK